ncbi:IS66 family transposase [Nonomuraea sp. NBC_00507]|uniref:IS66 family transposase n=1 Tax=Nonomuraea sp. NBC_00507 TaxID=2976002 RepID=UPI003FA5AD79
MHRVAELVVSLTGAESSPRFVHSLIGRAAAAIAAANARIRMLLTLAYVVCCDETPIRVGPKKAKKYLLVACNKLADLVHARRTRPGHLQAGRAGRPDRRGGARPLSELRRRRPRSTRASTVHGTHLLRDLEDCAETYPDARWPRQLQTALRGLIHAANLAAGRARTPLHRAPWHCSRRCSAAESPSACRRSSACWGRPRPSPSRVLLEVLRDRAGEVRRFACDLRIPPTNNQAEVRHEAARYEWTRREESRPMMLAA